MPYEDKTQLGTGHIRKPVTSQIKGELMPGLAVDKGELIAISTETTAMAIITADRSHETITFTHATETVNLVAHGLAEGDPVFISGGTLPAGMTAGERIYYVETVVDDDSFTLSRTPGGAVVLISGNGTGPFELYVIDTPEINYIGLLYGAREMDTVTRVGTSAADFRTNLVGASSTAKAADDIDRALVVFTRAVVELPCNDSAGLPVGSYLKLQTGTGKFGTASFIYPFEWTLGLDTTEDGVVSEQAPIRFPDHQYAVDYAAGTVHQLSALSAPVKASAILRTRFR